MKNTSFIRLFLSLTLAVSSVSPRPVIADEFVLPQPGAMVYLSPPIEPPMLKGIKVYPENPFRFDFILDKGDKTLGQEQIKNISTKLIKYFLASLTIPEKDLWVNLSPYEKDRIIPESFGLTEMGRDLLAEDYMLKQITATLVYPERDAGRKFWSRVYEESNKKFGTSNIPVSTFNKVWIVPQKAVIFENTKAGTAYVVESTLKVMLEEDYLSLQRHRQVNHPNDVAGININSALHSATLNDISSMGANIVREIVIPELTKEVNQGRNFEQLRQVYHSLILATWYKKKVRDSLLAEAYADKNKVAGVNTPDPQEKEKIYQRYLRAFKKGVYNYIKEEQDPLTRQTIPRKYFSGGELFSGFVMEPAMSYVREGALIEAPVDSGKDLAVTVKVAQADGKDLAQTVGNSPSSWSAPGAEIANLKDKRELIINYLMGRKEHDLTELQAFGAAEGFSPTTFMEYVRELSGQKALKPSPLSEPEKFTSFLPTFHEDGTPTGKVKEYWAIKEDGNWVMAANIFIFNTNGNLLLQIRKDGTLDSSVGGSVDIGLNGQEAAVTEASEEFELAVTFTELVPVRNPRRNDGFFYYNFDRNNQQEGFDLKGIFHAPTLQKRPAKVIKQTFLTVLLPTQQQEWETRVKRNIISWEDYLSGKKRDLNSEVSGIVEVNPAVLLNYYLSVRQDPVRRAQIFAQGFYGDLENEVIRHTLEKGIHQGFFTTPFLQGNAFSATATDSAMRAFQKGGIDLTPANMRLEEKSGSGFIKFHVDPHLLQQIKNVPGFIPVIINIQPVNDVRVFLGLPGHVSTSKSQVLS